MTVVGFDFGTTNSLVSVIAGQRAISLLDESGLPIPSVVGYEGTQTLVGQDARKRLGTAGLGVHGSFVRSPKTQLGRESIVIGGVPRSPIDVVQDVVQHVKNEALQSNIQVDLKGLENAVVTIPIDMNGARRRSLREAFANCGIRVAQYVHEPFAALYGLLRSSADVADQLRELRRNLILVVDWGGGTLDLTLCRFVDGALVQLQNHGTEEVGGDEFDQAIRRGVMAAHMNETGLDNSTEIDEDARLRLLHQSEEAKIELSSRGSFAFYVPAFYRDAPDPDLVYSLGRVGMESMIAPMVTQGMGRIRALLDRAGVSPAQVSLCVATGGMASMPAIRSRLNELFGPACVRFGDDSATLISQGAAWVAHDGRPLTLARSVELRLARSAYLPIVRGSTEMPTRGHVLKFETGLYCADPRDGMAKFQVCTPTRSRGAAQTSEPRTPLADFSVRVHSRAEPLRERLELTTTIDDDLVMELRARSLMAEDQDAVEIHDLEFGLSLPESDMPGSNSANPASDTDDASEWFEHGDLVARGNLATSARDKSVVPGELLYEVDPVYFDRRFAPPRVQEEELVYYRPCAICGRANNDPACQCSEQATG